MSKVDDAAEKRAYGRGYSAGQRRAHAVSASDFRDRVFLAVLGSITSGPAEWKFGNGAPAKTMIDRVRLAWMFADEAVKQRAAT